MSNITLNSKILLNKCKKCKKCCVPLEYEEGTECDNCLFTKDGKAKFKIKHKSRIIVGLFKHQVFFFIFNKSYNWKLPKLPISEKFERWDIHHKNENHWNDSKSNLNIKLRSEHSRLHANNISDEDRKRRYKKLSKTLRKEVKEGTHHTVTNNPMKNKEISKKVSIKQKVLQKKKVDKGEHIFITGNPVYSKSHPVYDKRNTLLIFLEKITTKKKVTNKMVKRFNYSYRYIFLTAVKYLIKKNNLNLSILKGSKIPGTRYNEIFIKGIKI